jgi:hypothetical protein
VITQVVKFLSEGSTSTVICKMSNFVAEGAVTPLPADGEELTMEARMENEEGSSYGAEST